LRPARAARFILLRPPLLVFSLVDEAGPVSHVRPIDARHLSRQTCRAGIKNLRVARRRSETGKGAQQEKYDESFSHRETSITARLFDDSPVGVLRHFTANFYEKASKCQPQVTQIN
jgi:hypothetical protein